MRAGGRQIAVSPLLNIGEAAKLLDVSVVTVRRWVRAGLLPCVRFSIKGPMKFAPEDIEKFIGRCKG